VYEGCWEILVKWCILDSLAGLLASMSSGGKVSYLSRDFPGGPGVDDADRRLALEGWA